MRLIGLRGLAGMMGKRRMLGLLILVLPMAASGAPVLPGNRVADTSAAVTAGASDTSVTSDSSAAAAAASRQPGTAITFSAVLQVEETEKAADHLVARAESLGGWFSRRSKVALELRLPTSQADSFIAGLGMAGVLLDRNLATENVEGEREELQSRLKARRAMLQDYYAMLKESGDSTVFTIQSEIVSLQTEIEQTESAILKLEDSMAYAKVTLNFRFQERMAPITTGQSRFRWLNRLDIPSLRKRFDYEAIHR